MFFKPLSGKACYISITILKLNSFVQSFEMRGNILIILILLLPCLGCRNSHSTGEKETSVTIASLNGPSSMGLIRLIDSINNAGNRDLIVEIVDEPLQVRKMMLDGSADFAVLPTTMAAILYNKGLRYRLVGIPVWGTLYLIGQDTAITSWSDLKNRRVNVMARGMTPDVLFSYLLDKNGIDPKNDIDLDYSFPTHIDLANAVVAGQAELGVLSEPMVSIVMEKNRNLHIILDLNEEWDKLYGVPLAQTAFLASEKILAADSKIVEEIINAWERSDRWVKSNPDSASVLIARYDILPDNVIAYKSIPRSNLDFKRAHDIRADIEEYLKVFYEMNPDIIGGKMPDENFIY